MPADEVGVNGHVADYLNYYLGLGQAPRCAVLLSGPWGSGKTYHAKKIVSEIVGEDKFVLVSLNGMSSCKDIDDALFAAVYPWTANKGARITAAVGRAVLKHAKIEIPDIKTADLINQATAGAYIFDDLERCRLPIEESLGYINQFVERDGCKVIVLSNEKEIDDQVGYNKNKEKLFGKTLVINPDFDAAFSDFITGIDNNESRQICQDMQNEIRNVYRQSGLGNLRILQQSMWDFARVLEALSPEHRDHVPALRLLTNVFFALSIELKSGRISDNDLLGRVNKSFTIGEAKGEKPFAQANSRYAEFQLYDAILPDQVFYDVLARGLVNGEEIQESLDRTPWFASGPEPAWRIVWHAFERDDDEVDAAAREMIENFKQRHYSVNGEVLHVFGQMLRLADVGVTGLDRSKTVEECKRYIDDLRSSGRLESHTSDFMDDIRHGSYGGLVFSQNETTEFAELWTYFHEQRDLARIERYPAQAQNLLNELENSPEIFIGRVAQVEEGDGEFSRLPVLAALDPDQFAEKVIALPADQFRRVLTGMSTRYEYARLAHELVGEREWAEGLEAALYKRAATLKPHARDRVEKNVRWYITKWLDHLRESAAG
jgi:hypothetical protein